LYDFVFFIYVLWLLLYWHLLQVDDIALNFKKAVMDQTFEKNRKRPDDPDFKYDVEVDFTSGPIESCDWDSDDDNDDNGF